MSVPSNRCRGRMGAPSESMALSATGVGWDRCSTTVWSSGVSTFCRYWNTRRALGACLSHTSSADHLTSAAVNGLPSCHSTPWRSLNVMVLPSSDTAQLSARTGRGFRSGPYSTRPSKILLTTAPVGVDEFR
ncbi:hypothetical protein D3C72_1378790 [compost metagenome]